MALNSAYQTQYDALLPQIDLASQQAQQARGMFYSGNAVDAQTKARADLLAKLAAQQAQDEQATRQQQAAIAQAQSAQENATKSANRNTNLGLIGSGVGAAATLYGLSKNIGANPMQNTFAMPMGTGPGQSPSGYGKMVGGVMTPVPVANSVPGVGGASLTPSNGGGLASLSGPGIGPTPPPDFAGGGGAFNAPGGANGLGGLNPGTPNPTGYVIGSGGAPAGANGGAAQPSMWNDPNQAMGGIAAGTAGGIGGYLAANQVNGGGKNTALASGLGGLAGAAAGGMFGATGNPYAVGAGALLGSFGGGLLGNLFK